MFGPGQGHNAEGFIKLFKKNTNYKFYYICKGTCYWQSSGNLEIITYKNKFNTKIKNLLKVKSFIWVHGGYDIKQIFAIVLLKNKKSIMSVNLWGEQVAKAINKKNFKGIMYRYLFKKIDLVHCNWYGVYHLVKKLFPGAIVEPWGLVSDFFNDIESPSHDFTKSFLNSLPDNKYKFFYPKSILPVSGQIEVIEACNLLIKSKVTNFIVYLWNGNVCNLPMKLECERLVKLYELENNVKVVEHPYLSYSDIGNIWLKMDCGLQIAKSDQLSTSFLEPQYFEKELIASFIEPYIKYNELFNSKLKLVSLNPQDIYEQMLLKISCKDLTAKDTLVSRKKTVVDRFKFDKNVMKIIDRQIKRIV